MANIPTTTTKSRRDFSVHKGDEPVLEHFASEVRRLDVPLSSFALANDRRHA